MTVGLVAAAILIAACGGSEKAGWDALPESNLGGRFFSATAWTGSEFVVWGGGSCSGDFCNSGIATPLADGSAFDPATGEWRATGSSPLSARLRAASVWTGTEMLIWGGNSLLEPLADGAAYDPAADSWRKLAASPLVGRFGAGVEWTGEEMLIWGGGQGGQTPDLTLADGAAYNPDTDSWRKLSASPLSGRTVGSTAWSGTEMLMWGGTEAPSADGNGAPESRVDGAAYDPRSDTWRTLAAAPLAGRGVSASAWTGGEFVIWGGGDAVQSFNDGAAYDPTADSWRTLPDSPLQPRRATASEWTGTELLVWGGGPDNSLIFYGDGAAYNPLTDRWRTLAAWNARFGPASAWTGSDLIVWGGIYAPEKIEVLADGARLGF